MFDLCVVGGGIAGAAVAWDAALRGLRVALIEREDFGGATSSGCFKIIHGGLRYLQHFDLARLYQSMQEQRTLRKIAPHLVRPVPFLIPLDATTRPALAALLAAGISNMEVTCRIKQPLEKLSRLRKELPDFVAGAASLIDWPGMLKVYNAAHTDDPLPTLQQVVDAGAGNDTVNVSTMPSIVVAAAGVAVGIWIRSAQAAVPVWSEEGGEE